MHYVRWNFPDWALHTAHLTPEEEGIYFRLLCFYYDTEQPIPEETQSVFRRLRLGSHMETATQILTEFFTLEDGFWRHKRCDSEIEAYHLKASQNRANGKRGGRPRVSKGKQKTQTKPKKTQSVNSGNPNETLTNNHKPITNNQESRENRRRFIPPTLDEVSERCSEMGYTVNPARFIQHYESNGWKVGKNKMVSWHQALAGWQSRENDNAETRSSGNPGEIGRKPTPAERVQQARLAAANRQAGGSH